MKTRARELGPAILPGRFAVEILSSTAQFSDRAPDRFCPDGIDRAMLAKRIIPCLDVHAGRVVKGINFLNLRDAGDPVEVASRYESEGADELVFLDITASHEEREIMLDVVRRTSEVIFMPLTVGGGIRTLDDIRTLLKAGCDKVSINSAAVKNPRVRPRGGPALRQPVHRRQHRPQADPQGAAARCGKSTSTAGGFRPDWKPSPGRARSSGWGPARSC